MTTDLTRLCAIYEHAERHQLVNTISTAGVGIRSGNVVFVDALADDRGFDAFMRWSRSVGAEKADRRTDYLIAQGQLTDGSAVNVRLPVYRCNPTESREMTLAEVAEWAESLGAVTR